MPDFNLWEADAIRAHEVLFSDHIDDDGLIDMDSWSAAVRGDET